jgi:hypothetical protein
MSPSSHRGACRRARPEFAYSLATATARRRGLVYGDDKRPVRSSAVSPLALRVTGRGLPGFGRMDLLVGLAPPAPGAPRHCAAGVRSARLGRALGPRELSTTAPSSPRGSGCTRHVAARRSLSCGARESAGPGGHLDRSRSTTAPPPLPLRPSARQVTPDNSRALGQRSQRESAHWGSPSPPLVQLDSFSGGGVCLRPSPIRGSSPLQPPSPKQCRKAGGASSAGLGV